MSFSQGNFASREAAADLRLKQYYIVKTDSTGKIVLASAATDAIEGVLANAPNTGDTADYRRINGTGSYQVVAGGVINKDAYLTTDANGKAIATTSSGNRVIGRATTSGVLNDIIEYELLAEKY